MTRKISRAERAFNVAPEFQGPYVFQNIETGEAVTLTAFRIYPDSDGDTRVKGTDSTGTVIHFGIDGTYMGQIRKASNYAIRQIFSAWE
jgi:hypothetical protein